MVFAKVNGKPWDALRPLEGDCTLEFLDFDSSGRLGCTAVRRSRAHEHIFLRTEAKHVFWHSSAHVLGQALERKFGGSLCVGPPLDDGGFYYDMHLPNNGCVRVVVGVAQLFFKSGLPRSITESDLPSLEEVVYQVIKAKETYERLEVSKEVWLL